MPEIIVALDYPNVWEAEELISKLCEDNIETKQIHSFKWVKIGLELTYHPEFYDLLDYIIDRNLKLFLDAKLDDIPTTVEKAVKQICLNIEPAFLSVRYNVESAIVAAAGTITTIVDVPQLTSDINYKYVYTKARAVACRPILARAYRLQIPDITIICPGVRLPGEDNNDHSNYTKIPKEADYIVVGRPITRSNDPREAFIRYQEYCNNIDVQ